VEAVAPFAVAEQGVAGDQRRVGSVPEDDLDARSRPLGLDDREAAHLPLPLLVVGAPGTQAGP
jgi:hypothetical protein